MSHNAAHTGVFQSRTRSITREHVVCSPLMRRFSVRHRTADGKFVCHFRGSPKQFANSYPRDVGLNRIERTTILHRRVWLWVKRFLMRHSTRHENEDNGLRGSFFTLVVLDFTMSRFDPEEIGKRKSADSTHCQKSATTQSVSKTFHEGLSVGCFCRLSAY